MVSLRPVGNEGEKKYDAQNDQSPGNNETYYAQQEGNGENSDNRSCGQPDYNSKTGEKHSEYKSDYLKNKSYTKEKNKSQ